MPAVSNIVLNDAQATPVAHTFNPMSVDPKTGTWWFEDQSASSSIAFNRMSIQLIKPLPPAPGQASSGRMNRVKIAIHTPKAETLGTNDAGITPSPTIGYIPRCTMEFVLPERASLQDRKDIRKYAQFVVADSNVLALIENLQNFY